MFQQITSREIQVLRQVSFGLTTKEIASRLFISNHTVISHKKKLMEKMAVKNMAELVRRGFEYGLLTSSYMVFYFL